MTALKQRLLASRAGQLTWRTFRCRQLERHYRVRRERYAKAAAEQGLVYDEAATTASVRERLRRRGYSPTPQPLGQVHTFAFVPRIGWHGALYPDLVELGPVTEFDYVAHGFSIERLLRRDQSAAELRSEMNELAIARLREAHARRPVDWVFVYASGLEVLASAIRRITEEFGVPIVNMCLDDKQSWTGPLLGSQRGGQIDIAAQFDLSWTSARVACEWYLVEDARPLYLPEGFDAGTFRPLELHRDIAVSFVGAAYGFRPSAVRFLADCGIHVEAFGSGWKRPPVWGDEQVSVFNRSQINLGMGGIGYSEALTNVKTRDFEIPGTGGGLYLTSFNPDLALHFRVGEEIVCYRHRDEMLELIRYYLRHDDEAKEIAARSRRRALREHRWLHRYERVCKVLGVLESAGAR